MAHSQLQKWGENTPNSTESHLIIKQLIGVEVSNIFVIKWHGNNMELNVLNEKKSLFITEATWRRDTTYEMVLSV